MVVGVRPLGEHDALVRLLTAGGLMGFYVHGARGRRVRAWLSPGSTVAAEARPGRGGLVTARLEGVRARPEAWADALAADALQWLAALTDRALPDGAAAVGLYHPLEAVLDALAQPAAWPEGAARYELELLRAMGFGPDWSGCALGGPADELAYASPTTGRALSAPRAEGQPWRDRLLPLPRFLLDHAAERPDARALADAFRLTGRLVARHLELPAARARALHRLGLGEGGTQG